MVRLDRLLLLLLVLHLLMLLLVIVVIVTGDAATDRAQAESDHTERGKKSNMHGFLPISHWSW